MGHGIRAVADGTGPEIARAQAAAGADLGGRLCRWLVARSVYPDVPPALSRWRDAGLALAIYSSGSVLAQRLLFSTTAYGDLTRFIEQYFDTGVGPKRESASYERIAAAMGLTPPELLFVTDVIAELEAARDAGMQVVHCLRVGDDNVGASHPDAVRSFDAIVS